MRAGCRRRGAVRVFEIMSHGGDRIAEVLQRQGVRTLFTLCGGHISPILAAAPGALIIELDEDGFQPREWKELMTVALYRRFLADPGYFGLE